MRTRRIEGFAERVEESIIQSVLSKSEIARRMGAGRHMLNVKRVSKQDRRKGWKRTK